MNQAAGENILIPLEKELQERLDWFIRLRWLAGMGILIGSGIGLPLLQFPAPFLPLTMVGVAVLLYNLMLHSFRDRVTEMLGSLRRSIHLQIAFDWAALSVTVYLTGGIASPVCVTYVFHIIIGAILLSRRSCYFLATAASLLLGLLTFLTANGLIWNYGRAAQAAIARPVPAFQIWSALTFFFIVSTYLATSITARLRQKEAALSNSERSLNLAYHEMEELYEVGKLVNSTLDVNEVLRLIAQHAARLLSGKACFIRLLDLSGKKLYIGGSFGLSQAYIDKGPVDVGKSLVDLEALRGKIIQVLEVAADQRFQYREEARREGLRSMLSCPMQAKNRILGLIRVYTAEPHVFTEQEQNLLMNVANLGALAIENARSYGDLKALDQERVWFARTTHHQLRSPLAAVQSAIDALPFAGALNEKQKALITRARRRVQDAFDTIRDLLDMAAAQHLGNPITFKPVNVAETLKRILEATLERARSKGLEFVAAVDSDDTWVLADPADLERIFSNLLDNALKYTQEGRVSFGVRKTDEWLEAFVEDTGMGIAEEDRNRIFEGFYRSVAAKTSGEMGTGLGLSIVRKLIERLGGTITLESELGKGTCVIVRLPTTNPPARSE